MIKFDWDTNKNVQNKKKHGVDFLEALTVFIDENAIEIDDPDHSVDEDRFIIIGLSLKARLLVVCYCCRDNEETIRIISARKATKREEYQYTEEKYEKRIRLH